MTNLSGNLSPQQKVSVACDGPQGVGMDILRNALDKAIPEGYKQTDIGVIPEDWETLTLDKFIVSTQLGGNYKNSESESNYPLIKMGNLNRGKIKLDKLEYVIGNVIPRDQLQYGDVLFNTRNTLELVGKVAIWRDELPEAYFNSNLMKFTFSDKFVSSNLYVNLAMNSDRFVTDLAGIATGTTSVAAIYTKDLLKLKLSLPPKKEQTAIANALSDMDALLSELEKLIAKKQAMKTATMQQLLTGQTRLPQFAYYSDINSTEGAVEVKRKGTKPSELGEIPDDWEVTSVASLCEIATGSTPPTNDVRNYGGEYLFISPADLKGQKYVDKSIKLLSKEGWSICRKFPPNSILFTCIGSTIGKCGLTRNWTTSNQQINAVFPSEKINFDYLYYQLAYAATRIKEQAGEQAVPIINKTEFGKSLIYRSQHAEEQTAIATILSDMDNEIQTLEQRLSKTRQIKQGMMQELLTGKTRLPFDKIADKE